MNAGSFRENDPWDTAEYTTAFKPSDWLYFQGMGLKKNVFQNEN